MATASPVVLDPSEIHWTMPTPAPIRSKSRLLDVLKLLVGLLVVLILAAILFVLIFKPHTSNEIDLRESNENIAKLERESNENIARSQREQQIYIENERQKREEIIMERQLLIDKQRLERQESLTEKHRLEERLLAEKRRKEDLSRENADLLSDFMKEDIFSKQQLNTSFLALKVHSLIHRFDPMHKSLLINHLYKAKLLNVHDSDNPALDLQGANLKDIDLDGIDIESDQVGLWLNYNQLALPSTNLINASFEKIYLNEANFSLSNMMGTSFRWSEVIQTNFYRSVLSLSSFRNANVSQSKFSYAKIQRASFQNANLTQTHMDHTNLESTNFQNAIAIKTNFSQSEISYADFRHADLSQAQMDRVSIRSGNFYSAKAVETNFEHAYMPDCLFQWANLTNASFKHAFLAGASFENTNVQNVDFTDAKLYGANITAGQLDVVLSIARAFLPDGSKGKNKNLVKNGNAQCMEINDTIPDWITDENVFINGNQSTNECVFQARTVNATLQQKIDIHRYGRLIEDGQGKVYIEMQDKTTGSSNSSVYMIVRFFDLKNNAIGQENSTLDKISSTPPPKFTTTLPCPSNTTELQITIVFKHANATVDNIYVTIE